MRERGPSFKQAVNEAIRGALSARASTTPFRTATLDMGFDHTVRLDRALAIADTLEDEDLLRDLATHK